MKRSVMLTAVIFLLVLMVFAAKAVKKPPSPATPPAPTAAMEPAATPAPVAQASPDVDEETTADAEAADEAQSDRPAPPSSDTPATPASRPQPDEPASQPAAPAPAAPAATVLPGSALADSLRNGKPTMVDFGAGWCRPCQEQEPILHQAAARYQGKANIVYIDTGEYADLGRQYGIRVIPTQIFFDAQGNEVSRHMGVYPLVDIDRELAALGATP